MEDFEEFAQAVVEEIKANPHKFPRICRRMVVTIDTLRTDLAAANRKLGECGNVLTDAAQLIDGWNQGTDWTEWDQSVRDNISKVLVQMHDEKQDIRRNCGNSD